MEENKENQPPPLKELIDYHLPSPDPIQDIPMQHSQKNKPIQQPTLLIHLSLEITLCPLVIINLDDDNDDETIAKIDE